MSTEVLAGPLGEIRAASTAGGGTALTTTAARIVLPFGTKWVSLTGRNYSTAVVCKFNFNPWIRVLKTTDLLATTANVTDYSEAAQDGSTATTLTFSSLDTLANLNAVYIGSHVPFAGLDVDVQSTNSNASVLTVHYWNGSAWVDTSATDNTASGGATLAQDGTIVWTPAAAWVSDALATAVATALKNQGLYTEPRYWVRLSVSAALDASVTCNSILAINRSTAYGELVSGLPFEQSVTVGPGGIASVTALTDAGTANLIVNVATRQSGRFQ